MTQQVYGVFNRFSNLNTSAQPVAVGTERDVSYRATGGRTRAAWHLARSRRARPGAPAAIDETLYLRRTTLRNGFAAGRAARAGMC